MANKKLSQLGTINTLPVNAFIHVTDPTDESQSISGSDYKINANLFLSQTFRGAVDLSSTKPTLAGLYKPTQGGTYTNWLDKNGASIIVDPNKVSTISLDANGVFAVEGVSVDITGYAKESDLNDVKIDVNNIDLFIKSNQLFNKEIPLLNGYYSSDGSFNISSEYKSTDKINIKNCEYLFIQNNQTTARIIVYFDALDNKIKPIETISDNYQVPFWGLHKVPDLAVSVSVLVRWDNVDFSHTLMIERGFIGQTVGSELTPYGNKDFIEKKYFEKNKKISEINAENQLNKSLISWITITGNNNKSGNIFNHVSDKIYKIVIRSAKNASLTYGTSKIVNNIATNLTQIGTINVLIGTFEYTLSTPVIVSDYSVQIWLGNVNGSLYIESFGNQKGFLDTYESNNVTNDFTFSFYPIYTILDTPNLFNERISKLEGTFSILSYTALGDSVSWGAYGGDFVSGEYEHGKSWCDYLSEFLKVSFFNKRAVSGDSIWNNFKNQLTSLNDSVDLVTIMFGLNDANVIINSGGTVILSDSNTVMPIINNLPNDSVSSSLYNHSVLGRYRWCLENIQLNYPNVKIVCVSSNAVNYIGEKATVLESMKQGQEQICSALGIEFIRLDEKYIFKYENFNQFLHPDKTHPLKLGYKIMAGNIYNSLS